MMHPIYRTGLVSLIVAGCAACAGFPPTNERAIPETQGFRSDSLFQFTISPDDRWLVFFKRVSPEERGTRHWSLGNLRVLDLRTGELHSFTRAEGQTPESLEHGDASWAPDSSHCVLPPPLAIPWDAQRGILIDLHDPANIRVVSTQVRYRENPGIEVPGEQYQMPERYTCADCSPHLNDVELIKKHIDAKYLEWDGLPINPNAYAEQIVSPDGTKIYYRKGARTEEVSLFERNIASGKERELASFPGPCAQIDRLRPSPDGRKLAFQLTTGCDFIGKPTVYVIDLATRDYQNVAKASGGGMHWTSDSQRLFFYRENYLHVAEFDKPAATAPAMTAPAQ